MSRYSGLQPKAPSRKNTPLCHHVGDDVEIVAPFTRNHWLTFQWSLKFVGCPQKGFGRVLGGSQKAPASTKTLFDIILEPLRHHFGTPMCSESAFWDVLGSSWAPLGPVVAAKDPQPQKRMLLDGKLDPFWNHFGTHTGPKQDP